MTTGTSSTTSKNSSPNTGWSERNIGTSWQYRFFYAMLRWLGKRPAYHIMYIVTFWYVAFHAKVRKRTRPYLNRRFPEHTGMMRRWWDSYQLVRHFGMTLVDMAAARIIGQRAVNASTPDTDRFMELARSGRGFLLLNAHVGCWQVGLSALPHMRKRVALVMIPDPRVMPSIDPSGGYVIDPREGLMALMRMTQTLLDGDVVSLMADRVHGDPNNVVRVRLFGDEMCMPLTPYRLASSTGCPIVLLASPKTGFKSYEVLILDQFEVPRGLGGNSAAYVPYAQRIADAIERLCARYPMQFFNFYDLWNDDASVAAEQAGETAI